ncbi:hypothetical protein AAMO2058_000468900 [Amorphochlora amoebiformis]|uniref:SnoaL-like domain-containing protein n=1 Tax=Amorphochlora amoebiformis TaxID=1561963 RepID=A0A7S0DV19_9EUKA|mmetsp:Transcript_9322/g.14711  ORF Transcript_9322/g.14711 Transcript_9322/m.14711 type:complete len:221 (+) Transcript_9322:3-665(+)
MMLYLALFVAVNGTPSSRPRVTTYARNVDVARLNRRGAFARALMALSLQPLKSATASSSRSIGFPVAPLGKIRPIGDDKRSGLDPEEIKKLLETSIRDGQYFINPDAMPLEVFKDDCRFKDPTTDVVGLSRYVKALGILFDPKRSKVNLLDIKVKSPTEIVATWTQEGYLKLPWNPYVPPYTSTTTWLLEKGTNLIQSQEHEWSISAVEALRETFTPHSR